MKKKGQQSDRSYSWILTIPAFDEKNPSDTQTFSQEEVEEALSSYTYSGQLERGESTGYLHWQVYIENPTQVRFSTLKKKFSTAHLEMRRGTKQQALDYVSKSETFEGVRIGNGMIDTSEEQGKRNDIEKYHELIMSGVPVNQVIIQYPGAVRFSSNLDRLEMARQEMMAKMTRIRHVKVSYLSGRTGTGKTRYMNEKFGASAYRVTNYSHPFDSYRGEKILILDEFRSSLSIGDTLNTLDGYPVELPARYRNKWLFADEIWMVSNWSFDRQYKDEPSEDVEAFRRRFTETNDVREGHIYRMESGGVLNDETSLWSSRNKGELS